MQLRSIDAHDMFWQQRSSVPTRAEWDALHAAAPILDDKGPSMRGVCEHYMLHRNEIERASGEADDLFFLTDRENASRIDRQRSAYYVGGMLNDVYRIYGAGAPFERLFFEARQQLDVAIRELAYERKEREFEKASDPRYDDYNFYEGYLGLLHAVNDYDDQLCKEKAKRRSDRRQYEAGWRESERKVRKLTALLNASRRREDKWHEKYLSVVGDQFGDRPASW